MTPADLPEYARLYCDVFRKGDHSQRAAVERYMRACFFENPAQSAEQGSIVQENGSGGLAAIMGFIPLPMIACGREITARLGTAFLADPAGRAGAAGRITTLLRAKRQDFIFSTTGAETTARSTRAGGGHVLGLQSLDFYRAFRPLSLLLSTRLAPSGDRLRGVLPLLQCLAHPVDSLLRRLRGQLRAFPAPGLSVSPVETHMVLEAAPRMVERFAIRPRWRREELAWQLDMAPARTSAGDFHQTGVFDADGALIGLALYYAQKGGLAELLNLLTLPGNEQPALRALLAHLDSKGHTGLKGEAHPWLAPALFAEGATSFRFRGNFCLLSRHPDIVEAMLRGDYYAGGLVGESWVRLVSDFR